MTEYKFIDYVVEGKMIRNMNGINRMSYTDACDLVLLYLLAMQVMRHYRGPRNFVQKYSEEVLKWQNWEHFRSSGNDLYGLLNIVNGDERITDKLKNPTSALALRQRTHLPTLAVKRLLRDIAQGKSPSFENGSDIMKIDASLANGMQSYSALRRKVVDYKNLTSTDRKQTATKIEQALKARGRNSDLVDYYTMFMMQFDLEVPVKDTEPFVSINDPVEPDTKDIAMLRLLGVPSKDLPFAYKAYSIVSKGQPLPPRFAQAYKPIMQIIDDIVKAGPGYVNLLKQVHNRAKTVKK
jgi:hypothetical protein